MPDFLTSIVDHLHSSAAVKSVYGDPISAHNRTIIPVARIAYGFGGGSGKSTIPKPGEGEGGGGGVAAIPIGVYEVSEGQTRFIPTRAPVKLAAAGFLGLCLGLLVMRRSKRIQAS